MSPEKRERPCRRARPKVVAGAGEDMPSASSRPAAAGAGVIDLVNGTQTARFAFDALRKGGKLVQVGLFGGEMNIPLPLMPMRALTIQGSYVGDVKESAGADRHRQEGADPGIPVELTPQKNADAVLNRLKHGQITGRVVLVAERQRRRGNGRPTAPCPALRLPLGPPNGPRRPPAG